LFDGHEQCEARSAGSASSWRDFGNNAEELTDLRRRHSTGCGAPSSICSEWGGGHYDDLPALPRSSLMTGAWEMAG
jgi:hypothetical protein